MLATNLLEGAAMEFRKAGASWAEGERFFDEEAGIEVAREWVRRGPHALPTAQRRMGETILMRELRRLADEGCFKTIFVDLEDASNPADAIAEIERRSRSAQGGWERFRSPFANARLAEVEIGAWISALVGVVLRMKFRAGVDVDDWRYKGDKLFAALAGSKRPVVLMIDKLPIFVDRLLEGSDDRSTLERMQATDEFLSWLRKNSREHRCRICMIVSGSASLEPILRRAGLGAHETLDVTGQMGMEHYGRQPGMALGDDGYRAALEMLIEAAVDDGYLERQGNGYRFVSGLLEDWWRVRYGRGTGR